MKKKREAMRQKMLMFKRHFGAKQHKGLGIIKDEIEQMVRRNAAELMQDFQNVVQVRSGVTAVPQCRGPEQPAFERPLPRCIVQASKDELGSELYALVQVAYHQRERLIALDKVAADAQRAQALEQGGSAAAKYATDGQRTSAGGYVVGVCGLRWRLRWAACLCVLSVTAPPPYPPTGCLERTRSLILARLAVHGACARAMRAVQRAQSALSTAVPQSHTLHAGLDAQSPGF